jgi:hypothetical protein
MQPKTIPRKLVLNTAPIEIPDADIPAGRQEFVDSDQLRALRRTYRDTHIFKRRGDSLIDIPFSTDAKPLGKAEMLKLTEDFGIYKSLVLNAYLRYLVAQKREIIRYAPVDFLAEDDLLRLSVPEGVTCPDWLGVRLRYQIDVRIHQADGGPRVPVLAVGLRTANVIDASVAVLMGRGVNVIGKYVLKLFNSDDPRLRPDRRLVGRVLEVQNHTLLLGDTREELASIESEEAFLEPRSENLQDCLEHLFSEKYKIIAHRLSSQIADANSGKMKLAKVQQVISFFAKQELQLVHGVSFRVGKQHIESDRHSVFPTINQEKPPVYVFGPSQKTDTWHNRGLEKFGPYDQSSFTPSMPRIAVICQGRYRGQTEQFIRKLREGVHGVADRGGREPFGKGLIRLYCLDKCQLEFFEANSASPDAYKEAIGKAIESAADRQFQWNLALVQVQESFHDLSGDANPYLISKAAFLLHGVQSQEIMIETMGLADPQLVYILNNVALACYAKLGGIPWLIQANRGMAHELVFGLGSASLAESRLGARERIVGITTVFTGDGNYVLENRSRATTMDEYPAVLLESLKATMAYVSQTLNWQKNDSVRLVFHAFKPFRHEQIDAVAAVVSELTDYHVQYAFLHVADNHPYLLFDQGNTEGVWDARAHAKKGMYAPQRGLWLHLNNDESLLILTGAREVKRPQDGLPSPILLRLDRQSTFQDMKYLTRQVFHFACHSWRSFFPSPMPITILYSELIASLLGKLGQISKWDVEAMRGPIGRTRWFL